MKKTVTLLLFVLIMSSCAELLKLANDLDVKTTAGQLPVSNSENISGLKNSLNVGIENAVGILSAENGFYGDAALKILLPAEAQPIIDNIKIIPGGKELVDKAILSLNRSAEDAVKEAAPIFRTAIQNMTITDAKNVLFGSENAATEYLKQTTYAQLKAAFAPKVKESLSKPLLANISTIDTWNTLTTSYNKAATSTVGRIAGLKTVNVSLEEYATEKALDALFQKIAAEEKAIRTDPLARVNDILKRVFGQLDKK